MNSGRIAALVLTALATSFTQYNPNSTWGTIVPGIRPQLSPVP
jgi:hypothetical protein